MKVCCCKSADDQRYNVLTIKIGEISDECNAISQELANIKEKIDKEVSPELIKEMSIKYYNKCRILSPVMYFVDANYKYVQELKYLLEDNFVEKKDNEDK
jgi:hypothetical protein